MNRLRSFAARRVLALTAFSGLLALAALGCGTGARIIGPGIPFPPLSRIVIAQGSDTTVVADTLNVGDFVQFTAQVRDTGNALITMPRPTWRSSNTAVATVNTVGRVEGESEGQAWIYATADTFTDSVLVLVLPVATGWLQQISNSSRKLNAVFFRPEGSLGWAVGDVGEILATVNGGTTWARQVSNTAFNLNGVWFTSDLEGWAVGNSGTALHTLNGGTTWTLVVTSASENLRDVTFATRDTGWAVGTSGAIVSTVDRGLNWSKQNPTTNDLHGVAFFGTRFGWAVGDGGAIVETTDRGLNWTVVTPFVTAQSLRGVRRLGLLEAWAAGAAGATPRTVNDGFGAPEWELRNAGAANDLQGLFYVDAMNGWACGTNGTGIILRTNDGGVSWSPQVAPNGTPLNDVFFVDSFRGWAVGDNGRILHTGGGGQ